MYTSHILLKQCVMHLRNAFYQASRCVTMDLYIKIHFVCKVTESLIALILCHEENLPIAKKFDSDQLARTAQIDRNRYFFQNIKPPFHKIWHLKICIMSQDPIHVYYSNGSA